MGTFPPLPGSADPIFAEWLKRRGEPEPDSFDALLQAHPAHAGGLVALHAQWQRLEPMLRLAGFDPAAPASFAERLRAAHGPDADPSISLDAPSSNLGKASSDLLKRLRKKSPGSRYRLEGEVARGGMGAILRVWDEDIRRHLAMKVVLGRGEAATEGGTPAVEPSQLARFLEEAQVTGQLDHPGIVPVHELGLDKDGRVFFTMKLVKGRDLKSIYDLVFEGKEGWNETRALTVLLKVCEAVAYAHKKGVIHRDLKPANIMVGDFGEVYVMDWGLARVVGRQDAHDMRIAAEAASSKSVRTERREEREETPDSPIVTMDGLVVGTPAYMSPEQALGEVEKLGPRSDVYAIGAMLYHLLARQVPYVPQGARIAQWMVLKHVQVGPPPPLSSLRKGVAPELVAICEQAMARQSSSRYADTLELRDDLRAYLERRVVRAYETGTWAETRKWLKRNRALAAALGSAVVVLIVGLILTTILARRARNGEIAATTLKNDLLARDHESRIRGLISALDYFETLDDDVYTYARSHSRPAPEWWIAGAKELLHGVPEDLNSGRASRPGLLDVDAELRNVRSRARARTQEDIKRDRENCPRLAEYDMATAELKWTRRMLGLEPWPDEQEIARELATEQLPTDALARSAMASRAVTGDLGEVVYGHEVRSLILARAALAAAPEEDRAGYRRNLSEALHRCGRFREALAEAQHAVSEAVGESQDIIYEYLQSLHAAVLAWESVTTPAAQAQALASVTQRVAELDSAIQEWRTWTFDDKALDWWHKELVQLHQGRHRIEAQLLHAESSVRDAAAVEAWDEAIRAIARSEHYRNAQWPNGDQLTPQLGLVPIGTDPETELWEFAHLATGRPAKRDPLTRKILLDVDMGVVLVLLPGGRVPVADSEDQEQLRDLTDIELDTFFLSKYEMTQAQWNRVDVFRRSGRERLSDLNPAGDISYNDCRELLASVGWLRLSTEAQWEYGCRAGTTSKWWAGNDEDDLHDVGNFRLGTRRRDDIPLASSTTYIGSMRPNGFGLHDVHGNATEWCGDARTDRGTRRAGDGLLERLSVFGRVVRGGNDVDYSDGARSSKRYGYASDMRTPNAGLRPARAVSP